MCPELPDPSNGAVMVSGLTVGSTASYTCDDGFKLSENILRMCETGGVWSGSEPLCEPGKHLISCVYIDGIGALWKCIIITHFLVSQFRSCGTDIYHSVDRRYVGMALTPV